MEESRIILPLDNMSMVRAREVIEETKNEVWGYKVRKLILEHGLKCLDFIRGYGKIIVDFKHYDIPMAMDECVRMEIAEGADITTVHMSADWEPFDETKSHVAGVTILTSMKLTQYIKHYHIFEKGHDVIGAVPTMVYQMACQAARYDYGSIVCSATDLDRLRDVHIQKICPGIRPKWSCVLGDDQSRITTPSQAIKNGADLLVIGRPILQAKSINEAVKRTNDEINEALEKRNE